LLGIETVLPRIWSLATERNLRGRSVSSGVRPLTQDQLNPCRPPEKTILTRLASVFAGHTRTNHPSCATAAVQICIQTTGAIKNATENARIHPVPLMSSEPAPEMGGRAVALISIKSSRPSPKNRTRDLERRPDDRAQERASRFRRHASYGRCTLCCVLIRRNPNRLRFHSY